MMTPIRFFKSRRLPQDYYDAVLLAYCQVIQIQLKLLKENTGIRGLRDDSSKTNYPG